MNRCYFCGSKDSPMTRNTVIQGWYCSDVVSCWERRPGIEPDPELMTNLVDGLSWPKRIYHSYTFIYIAIILLSILTASSWIGVGYYLATGNIWLAPLGPGTAGSFGLAGLFIKFIRRFRDYQVK